MIRFPKVQKCFDFFCLNIKIHPRQLSLIYRKKPLNGHIKAEYPFIELSLNTIDVYLLQKSFLKNSLLSLWFSRYRWPTISRRNTIDFCGQKASYCIRCCLVKPILQILASKCFLLQGINSRTRNPWWGLESLLRGVKRIKLLEDHMFFLDFDLS